MAKPLRLVALASAATLVLAGCGSSDSGPDPSKDPNYNAPLNKKTSPGAATAPGGAAPVGKTTGD